MISPQDRDKWHVQALVKSTSFLSFFAAMEEQPVFKEKEIHKKCCKKLLYSFCQKGSTVIRIATAPDKFFVTLKGSVMIFIPRDPTEISSERKLLSKILNYIQVVQCFCSH